MTPVFEKLIEKRFVRYAEKQGCKVVKFSDPSRKGAPDRIIFCPNTKVFFIEFKRPNGVVSPHQKRYAKELSNLGFSVYFCFSFNEGKKVLDWYLK